MKRGSSLILVLSAIFLLTGALIEWACNTGPQSPVSPNGANNGSSGKSVHNQSPQAVGYPDLTVDTARLAHSISFSWKIFKATDCAVVESCITVPGKRKLLRFDVATPNFGTADLVLGDPASHPEWFVYSPCHNHFHLKGFSTYRLRNATGIVVSGHKQAFCLEDVSQYWKGYPTHGYTCSNQGISVGWGDLYQKTLDCQWLDITNVASGNYLLEVVINQSRFINEGADVYPDSVAVPVTIP